MKLSKATVASLALLSYLTTTTASETCDVKHVSTGKSHFCILTTTGHVKCLGSNYYGQLGVGPKYPSLGKFDYEVNVALVDFGSGRTANHIASGDDHNCAILSDNQLVCWGLGSSGQLGVQFDDLATARVGIRDNQLGDNLRHVQFGDNEIPVQVAAGRHHSCALLNTTEVKCWGKDDGQVGREQGEGVFQTPGNPVNLGVGLTVQRIFAGSDQTCAQFDDLSVKCWGANKDGSLGAGVVGRVGTSSTQMGENLPFLNLGSGRSVKDMQFGYSHACAVLDDDTVKCWGKNLSGQLGLGDDEHRGLEKSHMGDALPVVQLGGDNKVVSIALGRERSCAVTQDQHTKCWGSNIGNTFKSLSHTFGTNSTEMGENLPAIPGLLGTPNQLVTLYSHTCAIYSNNQIECWGSEYSRGSPVSTSRPVELTCLNTGQCFNVKCPERSFCIPGELSGTCQCEAGLYSESNNGTLTTTVVTDGVCDLPNCNVPSSGDVSSVQDKIVALAEGYIGAHSCVLFESGSVKCWGYNEHGGLGQENTEDVGFGAASLSSSLPHVDLDRKAKKVVAGGSSTCVILDNDQLKCFGFNKRGGLGQGHSNSIGVQFGEMGGNLTVIDLGTNRTVVQVSVGEEHVCAVLDTRDIKCWGSNSHGQLGIGSTNDRGSNPNEMGDNLPVVNLGENRTALQVSAGGTHTCAVLDNNSIKCWGSNSEAQLGLGDRVDRGANATTMGDQLPYVSLGSSNLIITKVIAGYDRTCALFAGGKLKCWGGSDPQLLGLGNRPPVGGETNDMGDNLPFVNLGAPVEIVSIGIHHTCAVLFDWSLKCWGQNQFGQLGNGNLIPLGLEIEEMGEALPAVDTYGRNVLQIHALDTATCALLDTREVTCWGTGESGILGTAYVEQFKKPTTPVALGCQECSNIGSSGSTCTECSSVRFGARCTEVITCISSTTPCPTGTCSGWYGDGQCINGDITNTTSAPCVDDDCNESSNNDAITAVWVTAVVLSVGALVFFGSRYVQQNKNQQESLLLEQEQNSGRATSDIEKS